MQSLSLQDGRLTDASGDCLIKGLSRKIDMKDVYLHVPIHKDHGKYLQV